MVVVFARKVFPEWGNARGILESDRFILLGSGWPSLTFNGNAMQWGPDILAYEICKTKYLVVCSAQQSVVVIRKYSERYNLQLSQQTAHRFIKIIVPCLLTATVLCDDDELLLNT